MTHCPRCGKDNPAEIHTCTPPRALVLADALDNPPGAPLFIDAADELRRQHQVIESFEQSVTDPENQPSQYGTVPLEWYLRSEALLRQALEALEAAEFHAKRRIPDASIEVAVQPAITAIRARLNFTEGS